MDRAKQLAMILQAIQDEESDFKDVRREHNDRLSRLRGEASKLQRSILSGQLSLVPDSAVGE